MNKKIRNIIILLAILAGGIIAAILIYNNLSAKYSPEAFTENGGTVAVAADNSGNNVLSQNTASDNTKKEMPAADFKLKDFSGSDVSLSDYYGKPIILNFWATWCPPCKSEMPSFDKVYSEYGDVVNFMMVNLTDGYRDTEEGVKDFISSYGYKFPVFFDSYGKGAEEYSIMYIPTTVFINADGTIYQTHNGGISEDKLGEIISDMVFGS